MTLCFPQPGAWDGRQLMAIRLVSSQAAQGARAGTLGLAAQNWAYPARGDCQLRLLGSWGQPGNVAGFAWRGWFTCAHGCLGALICVSACSPVSTCMPCMYLGVCLHMCAHSCECHCISERVPVSVYVPLGLFGHLCVCLQACDSVRPCCPECLCGHMSTHVPELAAAKMQRSPRGQLGMLSPRASACSVLS